MTKTPASNTVKELRGYPVQNSPSGNYFWGGPVGRGGKGYDIVWRRCPRRTPWMMLRTPVCSYPIIVSHLGFNFLCLLLLYSIYLNVYNSGNQLHSHTCTEYSNTPMSISPPFPPASISLYTVPDNANLDYFIWRLAFVWVSNSWVRSFSRPE